MSKAEEKAIQYCCTKCANNKLNCGMKLLSNGRNCIECSNYIEGYHQAEKDLELTWKDVSKIRQIMFDYNAILRAKMCIPNDEDYCKEILRRYKENI